MKEYVPLLRPYSIIAFMPLCIYKIVNLKGPLLITTSKNVPFRLPVDVKKRIQVI